MAIAANITHLLLHTARVVNVTVEVTHILIMKTVGQHFIVTNKTKKLNKDLILVWHFLCSKIFISLLQK